MLEIVEASCLLIQEFRPLFFPETTNQTTNKKRIEFRQQEVRFIELKPLQRPLLSLMRKIFTSKVH
jgi:hypothetical protein